MADVVKPCPFCGADPPVAEFIMTQGGKWGSVICTGCEAQGPTVRTDYAFEMNAPWHQEAIEEWNKRE